MGSKFFWRIFWIGGFLDVGVFMERFFMLRRESFCMVFEVTLLCPNGFLENN